MKMLVVASTGSSTWSKERILIVHSVGRVSCLGLLGVRRSSLGLGGL
jgi:hypothetical protein